MTSSMACLIIGQGAVWSALASGAQGSRWPRTFRYPASAQRLSRAHFLRARPVFQHHSMWLHEATCLTSAKRLDADAGADGRWSEGVAEIGPLKAT